MVASSLSQRMRKLQTKLLSIRLGSGAYVLPKDIKRIHLRFAPKINGGHMGPRYVVAQSYEKAFVLTNDSECFGATNWSASSSTTQQSP